MTQRPEGHAVREIDWYFDPISPYAYLALH